MSTLLHRPPFDDSIMCQACSLGQRTNVCRDPSCPCLCTLWSGTGIITWDEVGRAVVKDWEDGVQEREVINLDLLRPFDKGPPWSEVFIEPKKFPRPITVTRQELDGGVHYTYEQRPTPWKVILAVLLCANLVIMGIAVYLIGR